MDHFSYENGVAQAEKVALSKLAEEVGTPAYIYSQATLVRHLEQLIHAFKGYPTLPCYAVKANSNHSLLKTVFQHGLGADVVSLGELERVLLAGAKPEQIVFSGVGKTAEEMRRALEVGIYSFNVESPHELDILPKVAAELGKTARISLRINPNIDADTNPKIATGLYETKFGISEEEAKIHIDQIQKEPRLKLVGLSCHIGSQITKLGPFLEAVRRMASWAKDLKKQGFELEMLDLGGGLGIRYSEEKPPSLTEYAQILTQVVKPTGLKLVIEPGRVIVGNVGVLLTRVIGIKRTPKKTFIIVDAAMNDLLRPTLYGSHHEILPVVQKEGPMAKCDIVGPICETGDFLGQDRLMVLPNPGDLLYVRACGAYAATMASTYNSRPRAPEVMVMGDHYKVVRPRELMKNLWAGELL